MSGTGTLDSDSATQLAGLAQQLRVDSVRASSTANSGHPTSSMSAADLMAVLLARYLRYDFSAPDDPGNDHLIFSKGHASPLLYSMFKAAGAIEDSELMTYRRFGSRLEGHPTPRLPWVDVATGSLGQGLPISVGIALTGKRLDRLPYHVWVLCGDSEMAEGSMWEAFEQASFSGLDNLTAIIDVNRLGQHGPTRHGWDTGAYATRLRAFGWKAIEIDGHDLGAIDQAFAQAVQTRGQPTAIVARTKKGRGVSAVEDKEGMHGKPVPDEAEAIRELGGRRDEVMHVQPPERGQRPHSFGGPEADGRGREIDLPEYKPGDQVSTRTAFGQALAAVGDARSRVVVLDGEVADSTRTEFFAEAHPDRFFEFYIAEQQMVAAAVGMQVRGWAPFASTFAAFMTRALDFIRMAAISEANIRLIGSHSGVSIGQDGPSQMGLEDLAALRAVYGSTVLYPCDGNQAAALTALMADLQGVSYLRTTRGDTPVIYEPDEQFRIGESRVLRSSDTDQLAIVAAGVTVHEALAAADQLAEDGISARVIDAYSVKPLDVRTIRRAARDTGRILTVEDHWPEGGLGDAVLSALAVPGTPLPEVVKLAVSAMPASATPDEQLHAAGIDAEAIAAAADELVPD
ncbi:MAG: transketolase [Nocardiopsaceae bacterium]|jgi:transketolase|nr:transketolase [Nocardiopsaceae bacterium]